MKIEINIGDRQLAFAILLIATVIAVSAVTAYTAGADSDPTGTQPAAMGHSADEVDLRPLHIDTTNSRVGIGESNPGEALDVAGKIQATGDVCTDMGGGGAGVCLSAGGGAGADNDWGAVGGGDPTLAGNIYHTGYVGIGTNSPGSQIHTVGTGQTAIFEIYSNLPNIGPEVRQRKAKGTEAAPGAVVDTDDLGGIIWQGFSGGTWQNGAAIDVKVDGVPAGPNIPTKIYIGTNDGAGLSPRMVIDPSGDVGIGTMTPGEALDVAGNIQATGDICTDQGGGGAGVCLSAAGGGATTPGTWCGLRMSAHGVPIESCDGHDPQVSCPVGYTPKVFALMGALGGNWSSCFKD